MVNNYLKKITVLFTAIITSLSTEGPEMEVYERRTEYNFLSRDYPDYTEFNDYKDFIQKSKVTPALTLVVYYSTKHCLNCPEVEQVLTEIYDRYKHHIR